MRVTIEQVTKRFGRKAEVDGVSLDVQDGELLFLLGPSGSGKTTLLRMVAGFIEPDEGNILFGGEQQRVALARAGAAGW